MATKSKTSPAEPEWERLRRLRNTVNSLWFCLILHEVIDLYACFRIWARIRSISAFTLALGERICQFAEALCAVIK